MSLPMGTVYRRAVGMAFLCGAVALFAVGVYLLGDSALKLIKGEHPTIQTIGLFGRRVWLGWVMIAALVYSVIPAFILGRIKLPLASELHDKVLHVSATLDKGDWMSRVAAVLGIIGDGWKNLRNSVAQLMNKRPTDIETQREDPVIDCVQHAIERLDWVAQARVRLREDGDILTGEAFVVPRDERDLLRKLEEARKLVNSQDWRLHDINVVPVRSVNNSEAHPEG